MKRVDEGPWATGARDSIMETTSEQYSTLRWIRKVPVRVLFQGVFAMRTLSFSGYEWAVRSSDGAQPGPGGNLFSDVANAGDAVWFGSTTMEHSI